MTYNITLTANHQSLTAKYLPLAAESVQYLTAKVVYETDDWTGREIKAMFGRGCTVYEVPVTGGEITAKQQLNLTAGDWRVWLVGNSARDGDVIPRITTNVAHIIVAPTGGTEGSPFPAIPPTVEEQLRADMGNLADLTTEDKSSLVAAINEVRQTGGGGVQPDWNQNDESAPDYIKNRPFYTGNPVETVVLEETTAEFTEKNGLYAYELGNPLSLEFGQTYQVSWDGTVYECVGTDINGVTFLGNLSILNAGEDTGEPFIAGTNSQYGLSAICTQDTSASHTISISGSVAEIKKIDEKYLPKRFAASKEIWFNATNDELNDAAEHYENGGLLYLAGRLVLEITGSLSVTGGLCFYTNDGAYVFTSNGEHKSYSSITTYPFNNYIPPMEFYLGSSTANSTKKFKIRVDDSGTITATEVT